MNVARVVVKLRRELGLGAMLGEGGTRTIGVAGLRHSLYMFLLHLPHNCVLTLAFECSPLVLVFSLVTRGGCNLFRKASGETLDLFVLSSIYCVIWGHKSLTAETGPLFGHLPRRFYFLPRARSRSRVAGTFTVHMCITFQVSPCNMLERLPGKDGQLFVVLMRADDCGSKTRIKRLTEPFFFFFLLNFVSVLYPFYCRRFYV